MKTAEELRGEAREYEREAQLRFAEAARLEREAKEARRPKAPEFGDRTDHIVVCFSRFQNEREYAYAAVGWKARNRPRWESTSWAVTGVESRRFNWAGLLEFIGEENWPSLHLMTVDKLIGPSPSEEPPKAEHVGRHTSAANIAEITGLYNDIASYDSLGEY